MYFPDPQPAFGNILKKDQSLVPNWLVSTKVSEESVYQCIQYAVSPEMQYLSELDGPCHDLQIIVKTFVRSCIHDC
mgnify:CR=1 FL=1